MAIQTPTMREALAVAYGAEATYAALFTDAPGATPGTEVTGGSYVRAPLTWVPGPEDGNVTSTATFAVPAGTTVEGFGVYDAATGGTYLDGASVTPQTFATDGTATLSLAFSQS